MEIKGFCSDCTIEEAERIFEEQYECSRREPTTVNVYIDSTSQGTEGILKSRYPVKTYCIFSKEQAIERAKEEYARWRQYKGGPISKFITNMKVTIQFDTKYAIVQTQWL